MAPLASGYRCWAPRSRSRRIGPGTGLHPGLKSRGHGSPEAFPAPPRLPGYRLPDHLAEISP